MLKGETGGALIFQFRRRPPSGMIADVPLERE
jgi:hypothetical protein